MKKHIHRNPTPEREAPKSFWDINKQTNKQTCIKTETDDIQIYKYI